MGNITSKTTTVTTTPVKLDVAKFTKNPHNSDHDEIALQRMLLDPRSPDVNRTPLPGNVTNRFLQRVHNEDAAITTVNTTVTNDVMKTPVNAFRNRLLNLTSNESKLLDPRSPSQFIPRTPITASMLDDSKNISTTHFSLEYAGVMEEASCRNFNERLANLTLDDSDAETEAKPKTKLQKIHEEYSAEVPTLAETNINDVTQENIAPNGANTSDPRSPSGSIPRTPLLLSTTTPTMLVVKMQEINADDDKNISPIVSDMAEEKVKVSSTFSSTPIVPAASARKTKLLKRNGLRRADIFEDDEETVDDKERPANMDALSHNKSLEALITPAKRAMKNQGIEKPRTPLGVLNRRSRSFENLSVAVNKMTAPTAANVFKAKLNNENMFATPKSKKKFISDGVNGIGFKPQHIQVYND